MKAAKRLLLASLFAGLTLVTTQSLWAASATQVPDPGELLQANSNAPGTKVFGTVSIFYTFNATQITDCNDLGGTVDMHIAIRARKGGTADTHTAGKIVRQVCYFPIIPQRTVVMNLIRDVLLQKFFTSFVSFDLKNADNLFQDEAGDGSDNDPYFLMMDFTLAVVE